MIKSVKFLFLSVLFLAVMPLFAETAKVTYVRGKVEVQRNDGNWYELQVGDIINESETISTGFYSDLKLEYNSSIIALGALTRVTLENLSSSSDSDNVSLYLNVGAVRSKVNHTKEKRVSYVVKSPVAVASVRGTDFTITANGTVTCNEGAVVVYPNVERNIVDRRSNATVEEDDDESENEDVDSEADVEISDIEESNAGDYGPATPTTAAKEIAPAAPAGSIVVGKDQTVTITTAGTTETPMVNATKKSQQAKTVVTTAASQEAEVAGSESVAGVVSIKDVAVDEDAVAVSTGSISTQIVLED